MKAPDARGTPIDNARLAKWCALFREYRSLVDDSAIRHWLHQFEIGHRDAAARVLDAVEFISHSEIETAMRYALSRIPGWNKRAGQRRGKWAFVPFGANASSGETMRYRFKIANGLGGQELFPNVSDLVSLELGPSDTVVFIDDFAGSGDQACGHWERSLAELLATDPRVFLILAGATAAALSRIARETGLVPIAQRTFAEEDNLFSARCSHFNLSDRATLREYCERADKKQPLGYGNCGLLVVFAHRCPNNSLAILHGSKKGFKGLFPRA